MIAVRPRIPRILKMFDPTILPMAISDCFRNAAINEVASSGKDVPTATTVSPINASDTPKVRAIVTAPSTMKRAPNINATSPPITQTSDSHKPRAGTGRSPSSASGALGALRDWR